MRDYTREVKGEGRGEGMEIRREGNMGTKGEVEQDMFNFPFIFCDIISFNF